MELRDKVGQLPSRPECTCTKTPTKPSSTSARPRACALVCAATFPRTGSADIKTGTLIGEACDIDYILVDNEKEALALENNLIKQCKPRFNILLRDDKTYPYIKLTGEKYPRVYVTRRLARTAPRTSGRISRATWRTGWCTSSTGTLRFRPARWISRDSSEPCLQYHIHRCLGPCVRA